jgi:hypothetical protein
MSGAGSGGAMARTSLISWIAGLRRIEAVGVQKGPVEMESLWCR